MQGVYTGSVNGFFVITVALVRKNAPYNGVATLTGDFRFTDSDANQELKYPRGF